MTLHVGAGTFQAMRVDDVRDHRMHSEWLNVGAALVAQVRAARARGGRVIAVGTTVVRALESASPDGELRPFAGETQIFIFPGYRIRSVDAMLTTPSAGEQLLMLVSASPEVRSSPRTSIPCAMIPFFSYVMHVLFPST